MQTEPPESACTLNRINQSRFDQFRYKPLGIRLRALEMHGDNLRDRQDAVIVGNQQDIVPRPKLPVRQRDNARIMQ